MATATETSLQARPQGIFNRLGDKYEPYVRAHLAKVYMVLGGATASTALGAILQLWDLIDLGPRAILASLGLVLGLVLGWDNGKNYHIRLGMLMTFGFCSGQTLGPLLQYTIIINQSIIITALLGTVVIFVSLSLGALLAERGKYLFLGGALMSVIIIMVMVSVFNMFFQSDFVQKGQLCVSLFVMATFVIFDTQFIVEKCRAGDLDVVDHAFDLFYDLLGIFKRILFILTQKAIRIAAK